MQQNTEPTRFIYTLTNVNTGIPYYGETTEQGITPGCTGRGVGREYMHLPKRHAEHMGFMDLGVHHNVHMQNAWDSGDTKWTFKIIAELPVGATREAAVDLEREFVRMAPRSYNIKHKIGAQSGVNSLTDEEHALIVKLLNEGHTGAAVARKTGRSTGTVSLIKNGKGTALAKRRLSVKTRQERAADVANAILRAPEYTVGGMWHGHVNVLAGMRKLGLSQRVANALYDEVIAIVRAWEGQQKEAA